MPEAPDVVPVELFNPCLGLDLRHPTSRLGTQLSPNIVNYRPDNDDWLALRPGTVPLGDVADGNEEIIHVAIFTTSLGTEYVLRWRLTGIDYYSGGEWIALSGPALSLGIYNIISATSWNDKLDFTDGATGVYEINFETFSYALIPDAPICRHITTFLGRLVASYIVEGGEVFPSRIQWSEKNDNTDWTSQGSGFEDLLNTPGGIVDTQLGVYPVSDVQAVIVRSGSFWTMESTGYVDTPFNFTSRFSKLRVDSQRGVCTAPGGIFVICRDDIYFVAAGAEPVSIGLMVRDGTHASTGALQRAQLEWDTWNKCLAVYVPLRSGSGSTVYRYYPTVQGKAVQGWFRDVYPYTIRAMASTIYRQTLSIGELEGSIEDLEGPISELGVQIPQQKMFYAIAYGAVMEEDEDAVLDGAYPVVPGVSATPQGFSFIIDTPELIPAWPLQNTTVVQLKFEYETTGAANLTVTESTNNGTSFSSYSSVITDTGKGTLVTVISRTIDRPRVMFRISGATTGEVDNPYTASGFKLRGLTAFCHAQAAQKKL